MVARNEVTVTATATDAANRGYHYIGFLLERETLVARTYPGLSSLTRSGKHTYRGKISAGDGGDGGEQQSTPSPTVNHDVAEAWVWRREANSVESDCMRKKDGNDSRQ